MGTFAAGGGGRQGRRHLKTASCRSRFARSPRAPLQGIHILDHVRLIGSANEGSALP